MISNGCIIDMEYLNTYIKTLEIAGGYSDNTIQAYSSDLKQFLKFLEAHTGREPSLIDINSDSVKYFLESEESSGFSASTLHRRKVVLNQFLLFLSRTGNFSKKELIEVLRWKQKLWKEIYNREIQYLTEHEIIQLFTVLRGDHSAKAIRDNSIISLMIETGLPVGKIIALDLKDIDFDGKKISAIFEGKTIKISISESIEAISEYITNGRKQFTQSDNENALFVSQMGSRISRQGVWQMVKEWGVKANLTTPLSPRVLRNTKIRQMVESGLPTADIQRRLGHSNRYSTRALVRKLNRLTK